jgi:GTPase SAR1 family protein
MGCDLSFINKFAEKHKGDTIRGDDGKMYLDKKILLLGLDNAGKTSTLLQFKEN